MHEQSEEKSTGHLYYGIKSFLQCLKLLFSQGNITQHTSVVAAAEVVTQRIIDCSKNLIADHYTCLAESSVGVRGTL